MQFELLHAHARSAYGDTSQFSKGTFTSTWRPRIFRDATIVWIRTSDVPIRL